VFQPVGTALTSVGSIFRYLYLVVVARQQCNITDSLDGLSELKLAFSYLPESLRLFQGNFGIASCCPGPTTPVLQTRPLRTPAHSRWAHGGSPVKCWLYFVCGCRLCTFRAEANLLQILSRLFKRKIFGTSSPSSQNGLAREPNHAPGGAGRHRTCFEPTGNKLKYGQGSCSRPGATNLITSLAWPFYLLTLAWPACLSWSIRRPKTPQRGTNILFL